ncbi:FAD binding domain-containing protein [Nisaea acidiphila]|uniref:FAD binding domain-containing protein n=1 Tax=Nisaea acidiphila TaxID=1862145 RepID=A0A9J7AQZ8_9PROT|nr:FAD binding domain-containing protein [Nisaea acidiphila]UUX49306.1 FAD binding domain-containing protein [Nisaea acidiphila]
MYKQVCVSVMAATTTYLRPDMLAAALDALASKPLTVAAGCTDLFPSTESKALPYDVLDITGIEGLSGIRLDENGLTIGGTTTWSEIAEADLPPALHALQLAAREVGSRQIQNRGTLAGNICNASPAADGIPPLLVLNAQVELSAASGVRHLPLTEYLLGPRKTQRRADEILTSVRIPSPALAGQSHFLKLGARTYLVISIAMTAARVVIEDGVVTEAALAVGACGPVARRIDAAEQALIGQPLNPDAITDQLVAGALSPIDDIRADAGFRITSAAELLRRTLRAIEAGPGGMTQ